MDVVEQAVELAGAIRPSEPLCEACVNLKVRRIAIETEVSACIKL